MKPIWTKLQAGWDSFAVGLAVFLFHLWHVPAVARGVIFQKDNLAFDFDIGRFVSLWGDSPFQISQNAAYYAVRHPLVVLLRIIVRPLVADGLEPHVVGCGVAAACAALSSVLAYRIARALELRRPLALLMTAMWTFSTASLLLGVLPEAYGLTLVALSWQMMVAIRWTQGAKPSLAVRIAAGVINLGITVTNVMLTGLVELVCRLKSQSLRKALVGTTGFSVAVAAIGLTLSVVSFHVWPVDQIDGSGRAAKQLYWSASSAEADTQRQSPVEVAWTFGAIAFANPAVAAYPSGDETFPYLYDLRGRDYSLTGGIAVGGWLALLLLGVAAAARDKQLRPVWIVAASWAAANIALHSYWQFRETVFLYAAHSHIAFFALVLAGARWAQARDGKTEMAYLAAAGIVTIFFMINSMKLYLALPLLS